MNSDGLNILGQNKSKYDWNQRLKTKELIDLGLSKLFDPRRTEKRIRLKKIPDEQYKSP